MLRGEVVDADAVFAAINTDIVDRRLTQRVGDLTLEYGGTSMSSAKKMQNGGDWDTA
jgi:hypothetical protein